MPDVRLSIANRIFMVTCQPGEEAHLARLGSMVDAVARQATGSTPSLNESRMLLFSSLLLADQLAEMQDAGSAASTSEPANTPVASDQGDLLAHDESEARAARALEHLAQRMEKLASALEEATATP
ncbi:MAG: cell division protein ZapA [Blastomonas sp.]